MSFSFQDWSGIIPRGIMEKKYAPGTFPEQGPYIVKVYATDAESFRQLQEWAQQRDLQIDASSRVRDRGADSWKYSHVDLYGDNLRHAKDEDVLSSDEVRELWFPSKEGGQTSGESLS